MVKISGFCRSDYNWVTFKYLIRSALAEYFIIMLIQKPSVRISCDSPSVCGVARFCLLNHICFLYCNTTERVQTGYFSNCVSLCNTVTMFLLLFRFLETQCQIYLPPTLRHRSMMCPPFFGVLYRISLCNRLGCPATSSMDQADG